MTDEELMRMAIDAASAVRLSVSPNPWVGCVISSVDPATGIGETFVGATHPPGGPHAEVVALRAAGRKAEGATLITTLEPCAHTGRTGPRTEAIIKAGVSRVVISVVDPDDRVSGRGIEALRHAGIEVNVGVAFEAVTTQLEPYLHHRRAGRPFVVLKMASTLDGRTAASDRTSRWITSPESRREVDRLRAESDAVLVGAGTVRADDPGLTVRTGPGRDPIGVVLGDVTPTARVQPCLSFHGDLGDVLCELGRLGVVQLLVEGGATVAHAFHRAGLVDRYVLFMGPALMGGDDGLSLLHGPGAASIGDLWRGEITDVRRVGPDLRVDLVQGGLMTSSRTPAR